MTGCSTGKKRYRTEVDAQRALNAILRSTRREVFPVRWYPCSDCKGFHLTSKAGNYGKEGEVKLKEEFEKYILDAEASAESEERDSSFPEILRDGRTQDDKPLVPLVNVEGVCWGKGLCKIASGPECAWCWTCGWNEEPGGGCSGGEY